jgi:hypothetical protein
MFSRQDTWVAPTGYTAVVEVKWNEASTFGLPMVGVSKREIITGAAQDPTVSTMTTAATNAFRYWIAGTLAAYLPGVRRNRIAAFGGF